MSVTATARVVAGRDGLPVLTGEGPLALRRTRAAGPGHRVTVVGAMSAPLGGDRLAIEVRVLAGARLTMDAVAASIALPGRYGGPAHYDVRLTVEENAELNWLPQQVISANRSDLRIRTQVELAATARLMLREEQILGRHAEPSGTLTTRLTVLRAGKPLLDQELSFRPAAPGGWDGPAVLGGHRAVGQLLFAGAEFDGKPAKRRRLGDHAVLTPLAGAGALVTAVAPDALRLRRALDEVRGDMAGRG